MIEIYLTDNGLVGKIMGFKGIAFPKAVLKKYLELVATLGKRHEVYNATLDELQRLEEGDTFIINPSKDLGIRRVERDRN